MANAVAVTVIRGPAGAVPARGPGGIKAKAVSTYGGSPRAVRSAHLVTRATSVSGKVREVVMIEAGWGCRARRKRVTTAQKPGPAPRAAQKRSGFSVSLQVTVRPSAVTARISRTSAQDAPQAREFQPRPPLSRNPPTATVGQWPTGNARSRGVRAATSSRPVAAGPTVAVAGASPAAGAIWHSRSAERSSSSPRSRSGEPDQLCPPEYIEIRSPRVRA